MENDSEFFGNMSNQTMIFTNKTANTGELYKDSKFSRLNMKAEEKKINLFYLKDILIKENSS